MQYIGYIVYAVALLVTVSWIIGVRTYTSRGVRPMKQTVVITMLFATSLIIVPAISVSPLHLLWIFPACFLVGMLAMAFPFSLLTIPSQLFYLLVCIGLDREKIARNQIRFEKFQQLVTEEGMAPEEAKAALIERGEW